MPDSWRFLRRSLYLPFISSLPPSSIAGDLCLRPAGALTQPCSFLEAVASAALPSLIQIFSAGPFSPTSQNAYHWSSHLSMSSHWRPSCLVHSTEFSMRLRHSLTYLLSSVLSPHSTEATSLCPWNFHHTCLLVTGSPPSYADALFHPFRWVILVSLGSSRLVSKLLSVVTPLVSL